MTMSHMLQSAQGAGRQPTVISQGAGGCPVVKAGSCLRSSQAAGAAAAGEAAGLGHAA